MEYRSTEYQVVQTSNPTGWKWTVQVAGRHIRTGAGYNRAVAIALAQRAIDKLLKSETNKTVVAASSIEGQ
jgi:macrodomain Ter protein organizer (MatP/YcbG family)